MENITAEKLVEVLEKSFSEVNFDSLDMDYIKGKMNQRKNGHQFTLNEYVEAMIYSMLSGEKSWNDIVENLNEIDSIFCNYDAGKIKKLNPDVLNSQLQQIRCGARRRIFQMKALKGNIETFERIEKIYGSVEKYVREYIVSNNIVGLIKGFCGIDKKQNIKLAEIGVALACEMLRNVGVDIVKPDRHICRILDNEHLGLIDRNYEQIKENENHKIKVIEILDRFAKETCKDPYWIDSFLWAYCVAEGDGGLGICTKEKPKCGECGFREYCNYPNK